MAEALGTRPRRPDRGQGRRSTRTASSTPASSACRPRSARRRGRRHDRPLGLGRDPRRRRRRPRVRRAVLDRRPLGRRLARRLGARRVAQPRGGARLRARGRLRGLGAAHRHAAQPRARHRGRHVRRRPGRVRRHPPGPGSGRAMVRPDVQPRVVLGAGLLGGLLGRCCAARACCPGAGGPRHDRAARHRRRHHQRAGRRRSTATWRSGPWPAGRSRRRRRSRGSSSSTPPSSCASCSTPSPRRPRAADAGHRRRHHEPAGQHDRLGPPDRRADRPALGWQDLRTVGECLVARAEHDLALAPNQSATKLAWLLANTPGAADRDLCFGTVDTWLAWSLSGGAVHVTDPSNAAVTGLMGLDGRTWNGRTLAVLGLDAALLPAIVDTSGVVGEATAIPGGPPIAALVGDQQASLVGQGCVDPGPGQDHVRHRRHARRVHRSGRPGVGPPRRARHVPDRRLVPRRRGRCGAPRRSCWPPA